MSKNLGFEFSALCGVSYDCGDIRFNPDGTALLSPVGHRLTRFGLSSGGTDSSAGTYGFEMRGQIRRVAVTKGCLAVIDDHGRGLLCNTETGAVLYRFNLKGECNKIEFSPDGSILAVAIGRKVQLWRRPVPMTKSVSALVLEYEYSVHSLDITSMSWAASGTALLTGSADCTAHLQHIRISISEVDGEVATFEPWEKSVTLVGHKTPIVGCYMLHRNLEEPCIITVAQDGAVFEWRFTEKPETTGKQRAKRKKRAIEKDIADVDGEDVEKEWVLQNRTFVQPNTQATVTAVASNNQNLVLFGFSDGIFALHELPSLQKLQTLSASKFALESAAMTADGAWLALGSPTMGQLLVWEWLSETFVLKQQGHYYNLNCVAYSPDGRVVATGGDDGKVKVWSTATNTSFVTFPEHEGSVTAMTFASNTALVTCSLDGTCRAFDLVRLRNFRTMTPPEPCQLLSVATADGEIICAGAMEPPHIYMWSLRTGKLLDTLNGHTGPVSCLDFCTSRPVLASSSWDGTIKLWEPFTSTKPIESLVNAQSDTVAPVNQLCVAFRPDGKALCSAGLDGNIMVWSVEDSSLKATIDCRRDLGSTEKANAFFTSLCYSADGRVLLAGGKSSWIFAYDVERELLLKKYQLAHRIRETDDGLVDEDAADDARKRRWRESRQLPGVTRGRDAGKRATMDPTVTSACIRFSPTGRSWAAATPVGMLIFSLDHVASFEPVDIDEDCTPQSTRQAAHRGEFAKAFNQALFLGENGLIFEIMDCVPLDALELVMRAVPKTHVPRCLEAIAQRIEESTDIEYNLRWALALFACLSEADVTRIRSKLLPSFRTLQRAILRQDKLLSKACDENMYDLDYALSKDEGQ